MVVEVGLVFYAGDSQTVHREHYVIEKGRRINQPISEVPEHQSHTVHYVEAFCKNRTIPISLKEQMDYAGGYSYNGLLTDNLHPSIYPSYLIYSDGATIYRPRVTQQLWVRNHGTQYQEDVRFLLSSHKEDQKLQWTHGIVIQSKNQHLSAGLYQFVSAENKTESVPYNRNNISGTRTIHFRLEKWLRIGEYPEQFVFIRTAAHHLVSIAGMKEFVIRDFPSEPKDFVCLKSSLELYLSTVANNVNLMRMVPRIIFMGNARVGKDAAALYYGGSELIVTLDKSFHIPKLDLQGNPPLGSLQVVTDVIGTSIAGSWFDEVRSQVIWSTPGLDGIETAADDISNVLSIKTLLTRNAPTKIVLAIKETDFTDTQNFTHLNNVLKKIAYTFGYRLNNDGSVCSGRLNDLKKAISVVITQVEQLNENNLLDESYVDKQGIQRKRPGLLRNTLDIMQRKATSFDEGAMDLLEFLADHPDRISFFSIPTSKHGIYEPRDPMNSREKIKRSIDGSGYISTQNPDEIHVVFKHESDIYIKQIIKDLNEQVTEYLLKDGVQKIRDKCSQLLCSHVGTADTLRQSILNFACTFDQASSQHAESFVLDAEAVLGISEITRNIDNLQYLHDKLGVSSEYNKMAWLGTLTAEMNTFRFLNSNRNPELSANVYDGINYLFNRATGELTLIAFVLSLTDVAKFIENNKTKSGIEGVAENTTVLKLNLFSLRIFLLDGNLKLNEATLIIIAPLVIQSVQSITIDVSGRPPLHSLAKAAYNLHGDSGLHGRDGGNFSLVSMKFRNAYKLANPNHETGLTVMRNGASGQNGQEGGDNTIPPVPQADADANGPRIEIHHEVRKSGLNQYDAEKQIYIITSNKRFGGVDTFFENYNVEEFRQWHQEWMEINYNVYKYRVDGVTGAKGNQGFAGGIGGLKGRDGFVDVQCEQLEYATACDATAVNGEGGAGGSGSIGGLGGRHAILVRFLYNGEAFYRHRGTDMHAVAAVNGNASLRERTTQAPYEDSYRADPGEPGDLGPIGTSRANEVVQEPPLSVVEFNRIKSDTLQLYSNLYYNIATDPTKQSLLGLFTNLPVPRIVRIERE